jgi:hypothetical protein
MGVIDLYFIDNEVEVVLSTKGSRLRLLYFSSSWSIVIGCTTSVAPEAIAKFFGYRLKIYIQSPVNFLLR